MSSAATVAPGNATTADQIDACINMHRDKRSKPSIEVVAVEETGESVRRVCHRTDMPHPELATAPLPAPTDSSDAASNMHPRPSGVDA